MPTEIAGAGCTGLVMPTGSVPHASAQYRYGSARNGPHHALGTYREFSSLVLFTETLTRIR